jgi:hypothetical protein
VEEGFYPYRYDAEYCPLLAPVRGAPRFQSALARAKERADAFTP